MNNDVFFAFVATFYPNLIYSKPITDPLIHTVMLQYPIFILIRCIVPHTVYDITAVTCQIFLLLNSASNMFTVCNTCYVWKKWQILKTKLKRIKASTRKISGWSVFISIFEIFYCGKLHWIEQNKNEQNIKEQNTKWLNVRDRRIHSVAKWKTFAIFDVHIFHGNTSDRLWLPWFER